MDLENEKNERIDVLHIAQTKIVQNKKFFCYGIDAVLLADFALQTLNKKNSGQDTLTGVDLCSGNAIIPILLARLCKKQIKISAVEVQPPVAQLAKKSVQINNLEKNIFIIQDDLKNAKKNLPAQEADFVTVNPPYIKAGRGRKSSNQIKMIARHEILCNLEDVLQASNFLLKRGAHLFMIHRAERINEIFAMLKKYNFALKEYSLVKPNEQKDATMILVKAEKDGVNQKEKQNPDIIIYKTTGEYSNEIKKIYAIK